MRMSGMRFQPSARIAPPLRRPIRGAVSRLDRYPTKMPSLTIGTACAPTPSSSQPNVPRPPGAVASATMSIEVRPVAEPALELVGRQEARPGVARLGAEHAVELGRVAARLVDLEVELRRVEHDREPSGRALWRAEQRDGLLGHRFGALAHAKTSDVLVARGLPAAPGIRVAPALVFVTVDRVGLDRGADVGDRLLGEAAVARGERLPFALRAVDGLGEDDARHRRRGPVGGEQVRDLRVERDRERVLLDGSFERAVGRRPIVEQHRVCAGRWPMPVRSGRPRRRRDPPLRSSGRASSRTPTRRRRAPGRRTLRSRRRRRLRRGRS